jgi:hypothetical protein
MIQGRVTEADFRYSAEQQGDFTQAFANCNAASLVVLNYASPDRFDDYGERLNAADRELVMCMRKRGYAFHDHTDLLP